MLRVAIGRMIAISLGAVLARPNVQLIAVDDLRPQFGRSFKTPEVKTPSIDAFFLDRGGSAMQHSYVQIAVCGPSRSSMLTSRRPDSTHVGDGTGNWCWCRRSDCDAADSFMTLPLYMRTHGYVTAGAGKIFHPDGCSTPGFTHEDGDDGRAWSYEAFGVEANESQVQWGSVPGPHSPVFNQSMGLSFLATPDPEYFGCEADESTTDGRLAANAVERLANFSREGIGHSGGPPFFHAVGFHKPHLPHIVPRKWFDLYPPEDVSLAPNKRVPVGFKEENWHALGTAELMSYNLNAGPEFHQEGFAFNRPIGDAFARSQRRAYFAATSFLDAQVGKVIAALDAHGFTNNTIVLLWSDHGWHLGDTNSWCKETLFETAARNSLLWRVPGQVAASKGLNERIVEGVDIFPTIVELTSLPSLPPCAGLDQPPTTLCTQGVSYASEFMGNAVELQPVPPKTHAFTQWPFPAWGNETGFRMGYSVRSASGYRYTEYVAYNRSAFRGAWPAASPSGDDTELYDYHADYWETTNFAGEATHAGVAASLRAVLLGQFAPADGSVAM